MSNQLNILLLLFGGLQGFLLSLLLIKKKAYRIGYGFLITYVLVMITQVLFKVISKVWLMDNMLIYYSLSSKLPLLYGPLVYLFTKSVLQGRSSQVKDFLHFVPFIFIAFISFSANAYFLPGWINFIFYGTSGTIIQLCSLLIYHWLSFSAWKQHHVRIKNYFSSFQKLRVLWLRRFILLSAFICSAIAVLLYFMYQYHPSLHYLRWGFILLSIFIYWISYSAIDQPALFSEKGQQQKLVPVVSISIAESIRYKPQEKYANTGLKEEEARRILCDLDQLMHDQKVFLDPEITIDKLAGFVHTSRHCLSQVLNERLGKSFYDYINECRVNEAKKMLLDPEYSTQKIASIAFDAGFNSLSTFNDVFRKMTGQTPSQYRKRQDEQSRQQRV